MTKTKLEQVLRNLDRDAYCMWANLRTKLNFLLNKDELGVGLANVVAGQDDPERAAQNTLRDLEQHWQQFMAQIEPLVQQVQKSTQPSNAGERNTSKSPVYVLVIHGSASPLPEGSITVKELTTLEEAIKYAEGVSQIPSVGDATVCGTRSELAEKTLNHFLNPTVDYFSLVSSEKYLSVQVNERVREDLDLEDDDQEDLEDESLHDRLCADKFVGQDELEEIATQAMSSGDTSFMFKVENGDYMYTEYQDTYVLWLQTYTLTMDGHKADPPGNVGAYVNYREMYDDAVTELINEVIDKRALHAYITSDNEKTLQVWLDAEGEAVWKIGNCTDDLADAPLAEVSCPGRFHLDRVELVDGISDQEIKDHGLQDEDGAWKWETVLEYAIDNSSYDWLQNLQRYLVEDALQELDVASV